MTYPADNFLDAVDLAVIGSNQLHQIINGDSNTEIIVEDGSKIPSLRKAYNDAIFFKSPIPWQSENAETNFLQLRSFLESNGYMTWWFAKGATNSTAIPMGSTPYNDPNWTLYDFSANSIYQIYKRLASDAGFVLKGTFYTGAVISTVSDVILDEKSGLIYSWGGTLPVTVVAGDTPETLGVSPTTWIDKTSITLRSYVDSQDANLQSQIGTLSSGLLTTNNNLQITNNAVAALDSELQTAQNDISSLQTGLQTAKSDIDTLELNLATTNQNLTNLSNNTANSFTSVNNDIDTLETTVSSIQSTMGGFSAGVALEALCRSYAEAGYTLVSGSFENGGTLNNANDVLLVIDTGIAYSWDGTLPIVVASNSTPTPLGSGGWIDRSDVVLRYELASQYGSSLIGSATYAQIRAYTGNATKINCLGRTSVFDKAHGDFYLDATDTTTPDDDGIVLVDALGRRWKRRFIGRVLPEWWGASANTAIDSSAALQKAFSWKYVRLSDGDYKTSTPLYVDGFTDIKGPGSTKCLISKTTTTVGVGGNLARAGAVTDSYAVNAIIIMRHEDNGYNFNSSISGVRLAGLNYTTSYGIYAPRTAHVHLFDVTMWQCQVGWLTHDSWMVNWDRVVADANSQPGTYGWATATGFEWRDDSAGTLSTGTSLSARNCWAKDCSDGWKIVGLDYSTLDSCGADNLIGGTPYYFKASRIVLNGCGMENIKLANGGYAIYTELSKITMNSCRGFLVQGATGAAYFNVTSGSSLVLNTCAFDNFTVVNGAYNRLMGEASFIDITTSSVPTNGNTFTGALIGGACIRETVGDDVRITDASGVRYMASSYNANKTLTKTDKAVASSGSTILTLTCNGGGGVEQATVKLKVNWFDPTYPTGAGYSEVIVVCYQDGGANYREALTTPVNVGTGNGLSAAPVYTITRSGNTWSVIMTPSTGALTCSFTVDTDYSGFTLATP